jgi:hypothetical protein
MLAHTAMTEGRARHATPNQTPTTFVTRCSPQHASAPQFSHTVLSLFRPFTRDPGNTNLTSIATALSLLADGALVVALRSIGIVRLIALLFLLFGNVPDQQVSHGAAAVDVVGNHAIAMAREEPSPELSLRDRQAALAHLLDHNQRLLAIVRNANRAHRCRWLQRQPEHKRALRSSNQVAVGEDPQRKCQRQRAAFDQAHDESLVFSGVDSRVPHAEIDLDGADHAREVHDPAVLQPASEVRRAGFVDVVRAVPGLDVHESRLILRVGVGGEGVGDDADGGCGPEDGESLVAELLAGCGQGDGAADLFLLAAKACAVAVDVDVELLGELGFEVVVVDAVAKLAAELAEGRSVHCLSVL